MSDTLRCPDCGTENLPGTEHCTVCGFPLAAEAGFQAPSEPPQAVGPPASKDAVVPIRRMRPIRPRRPQPGSNQALTLWIVFGTICAAVVIYVAISANVERATKPVEGSNVAQQTLADSLTKVLSSDSTNVRARAMLGDILYDTANWPDAIVQYRAAIRMDSSLVHSIVDLGVCYYNLGDAAEAERHFQLALVRDPNQPVALFNMGIVMERRERYREALQYLHRALQSNPPENMHSPLVEAMQRVQKKLGAAPQPLPVPGAR